MDDLANRQIMALSVDVLRLPLAHTYMYGSLCLGLPATLRQLRQQTSRQQQRKSFSSSRSDVPSAHGISQGPFVTRGTGTGGSPAPEPRTGACPRRIARTCLSFPFVLRMLGGWRSRNVKTARRVCVPSSGSVRCAPIDSQPFSPLAFSLSWLATTIHGRSRGWARRPPSR
ncbi:uncharacterized protein BKA78DRAFT_145264 [Phyllosticta capitalensis]|uniref:uncharacterized protein n=1 Tax=Phyllosticta capitalensis TaxID=121624 RepID=UPI00312DB7E3